MSSPKPKRPKTKAYHSSFIDRIHRRHDIRHHPGEDRHPQSATEDAPLLQEEHPDTPDVESQYAIERSSFVQQLKNTASKVFEVIRQAGENIATRAANGAKSAGEAYSKGAEATKTAASKTGQKVKNNPKRGLTALCFALTAIVVGESIDIAHHHSIPQAPDVCFTPACVQAASGILQNMHPDVYSDLYTSSQYIDPCTEFDEYVCGGFGLRNDVKQNEEEISIRSLMAGEVQITLRHILEKEKSSMKDVDREIFTKVQDAFTACMDVQKLLEYDIKPLKQLTEEIKIFFTQERAPVRKGMTFQAISQAGMTDTNALTIAYIHMMQMGINVFVSFNVEIDVNRSDAYAVFASPNLQGSLPSRKLYDDKETVAGYREVIASTLAHFYHDFGNSSKILYPFLGTQLSTRNLARGIIDLESKISKIMLKDSGNLDEQKSYIKMNYTDFQKLIPQLSLKSIARELSPKAYNESDVLVASPAYFQQLSSLISGTPRPVMQAFFVWKIIQEHATRVESDVLKDWKEFSSKIHFTESDNGESRWARCVGHVNADLGWILSRFYVDEKFSPDRKDFAGSIVENVRTSFNKLLLDADWMTPHDRQHASHIVEAINQKVGYPNKSPDIHNPASLKQYYNAVVVNNNTYLKNKLSSDSAKLRRSWSRLGHQVNKDVWHTAPTVTDITFDASTNEIVFPAAVLAVPLLPGSVTPSYLSYGAFGAVAGHLVSHSLQFQGLQYGKHGMHKEWWSNETQIAFEKKAICFIDQYSKYSIDGPEGKIYVNGNLTLAENIADANGVHVAYNAWSKVEATNASQLLPGLERFSPQQLFWLSYGNSMCSKITKEAAVSRILTDSHAPNYVRIRATVTNSKGFQDAFRCKTRAPECEMW